MWWGREHTWFACYKTISIKSIILLFDAVPRFFAVDVAIEPPASVRTYYAAYQAIGMVVSSHCIVVNVNENDLPPDIHVSSLYANGYLCRYVEFDNITSNTTVVFSVFADLPTSLSEYETSIVVQRKLLHTSFFTWLYRVLKQLVSFSPCTSRNELQLWNWVWQHGVLLDTASWIHLFNWSDLWWDSEEICQQPHN